MLGYSSQPRPRLVILAGNPDRLRFQQTLLRFDPLVRNDVQILFFLLVHLQTGTFEHTSSAGKRASIAATRYPVVRTNDPRTGARLCDAAGH